VLGRPCYAKFMAVPNYTYLKLKMTGPNGVITVGSTYRHVYECDVECVEYAEALAESEALIADLECCWGEGEDATLRSRPSPWSSVQRRQDNGRRHPSLHTTSGEDLQRGHPTVRPRPAWRPTGDLALCRGPCVATACYGPNL
jgi:hypothetical protein